MEAAQPTPRTHCSVCGSKIVRKDMVYCIYCGNNFSMMDGSATEKRKETRNMTRLKKMPEHPDFGEALERDRGEGPEFDGWRRGAASGFRMAVIGAVFIGFGAMGSFSYLLISIGVLALGYGLFNSIRNKGLLASRQKMPLMRRPSVVTDRRSETEMKFNTGITTYYFTLEFDDGNEAEFRFPGRGYHTEPLSKGITGIAHTRGTELIEFEQVRV
ncbi:MAG: hypothetical protein ACI87A_002802 [Planctomycetota bacterium]|jgi:hypothetical protein